MFSSAVRCGKRLKAWKTVPMLRRCARRLASSNSSTSPSIDTWPESGRSRPATVRSRVVLPPPEGPITTSALASGRSMEMSSRTGRRPKDLERFFRLSCITVFLFQVAAEKRNRESQQQIANRQRQIAFERTEGERVDLLCVEGEFADGDNRQQRGILDQRRELACQGGQDPPHHLRKYDKPVRLEGSQADGICRFQL